MSNDTNEPTKHWTDKAEPKYWTPRKVWRVRVMRDGKAFQWVLKSGKGDSGPSGWIAAKGEWNRLRATLKASERLDTEDPFYAYETMTDDERDAFHSAQAEHSNYKSDPLSLHMSFDRWKKFKAFEALDSNAVNLPRVSSEVAKTPMPLATYLDQWAKSYERRYELFKSLGANAAQSDEAVSFDTYNGVRLGVEYLKAAIGHFKCEPKGDFSLSELSAEIVLIEFRKTSMENLEGKLHRFNQRMKHMRNFIQWLFDQRTLEALPRNLARETAKLKTESEASPIPFDIVRKLYAKSDARMKAFILLALNCGFRQTEIASLKPSHIKTVGEVLCIEKRRGKTGVPLAIPLWAETIEAINKVKADSKSLLFETENGLPLKHESTDAIRLAFNHVRAKVKGAEEYSFQNFRDTGATFIDSKNAALTSLYLAHSDKRTARLYVNAGESDINLNGVLKELRLALALK